MMVSKIEAIYAQSVKDLREEWLTNESWYNHILELPGDQKITYLIVILKKQVFNGGFHQYFMNGYGQFGYETVDGLKTIGAADASKILSQALELVNADKISQTEFRRKILHKKLFLLFNSDQLINSLDELDSQFYKFDVDIDLYLSAYLDRTDEGHVMS